jgi:hypothetical protein
MLDFAYDKTDPLHYCQNPQSSLRKSGTITSDLLTGPTDLIQPSSKHKYTDHETNLGTHIAKKVKRPLSHTAVQDFAYPASHTLHHAQNPQSSPPLNQRINTNTYIWLS